MIGILINLKKGIEKLIMITFKEYIILNSMDKKFLNYYICRDERRKRIIKGDDNPSYEQN